MVERSTIDRTIPNNLPNQATDKPVFGQLIDCAGDSPYLLRVRRWQRRERHRRVVDLTRRNSRSRSH